MTDVRFEGPIDQAAAGNVINKGGQFSNVVNLNVGVGAANQSSGEFINYQQKQVLRDFVAKICDAEDSEPLDVWTKVLARAGASRVKYIPKEKYVELEEYLNELLREARKPAPEPLRISPAPPAVVKAPEAKLAPCKQCAVARDTISRTRKLLAVAVASSIFLACGAVYLVSRAFATSATVKTLEQRVRSCEFNGQSFSIGSLVEGSDGIKYECADSGHGLQPAWRAKPQLKPQGGRVKRPAKLYAPPFDTNGDDEIVYHREQ